LLVKVSFTNQHKDLVQQNYLVIKLSTTSAPINSNYSILQDVNLEQGTQTMTRKDTLSIMKK